MAPIFLHIPLKQQSKNSKKCFLVKKNLETCMATQKDKDKDKDQCVFYKKILRMCMERKTKVVMSGP